MKIQPEQDDIDSDLLSTDPLPPMTSDVPYRAGSHLSSTPTTHPRDITSDNTPPNAIPSNDINMTDFTGNADVMQALGKSSRELIQVIQELETLNIDSTLPSLPKFVVIGDQSAGKSSIIEAICDINLPRSDGTCTRCPYKITTTASKNGSPWSCKISIHKKYSFVPNTQACETGSTFDGWMDESDLTVHDFVTLHNKQELDVALRRAQMAVLNPSRPHLQFTEATITTHDPSSRDVGFSPNIISLEIAAPDLPELSFYDLPGAINTMGDESEQYLVEFVETLLKSYIRDEKAFIVLACAANQDLEISTALRFLRDCKASHRSMGVLTKPDLMELTENRVKNLEQLLLGRAGYKFGDGCFVTRQLSQMQLDSQTIITHQEARQYEGEFFAKEPWSTGLSAYARRFGIPNLQAAISEKLTAHILNDLPEIVNRVQSRLNQVQQELKTFPVKSSPHTKVHTSVLAVVKAISDQINPNGMKSAFRTDYMQVFRSLGRAFQTGKPEIIFDTPGYEKPSISIDTSEDESPCKTRKTNKGRAMDVTPNIQSAKSSTARQRATPKSRSVDQDCDASIRGKVIFRLDEVKAKFESAPGADLPGQVSQAVVRDLILDTLGGWNFKVSAALKKVPSLFRNMLRSKVTDALAQYQGTLLFKETIRVTEALFEELFEKVRAFVAQLVAAEKHRPLTYNEEVHKNRKTELMGENQKQRQIRRVDEYYDTQETVKFLKVPSKTEQHKRAADADWVNTTLGVDQYDREVAELATALAYYEMASAQLVDSIAKQFEYGLMHEYENRLHPQLLKDLNTGDVQYCGHLLAEGPERERSRLELEAEKARLEQAVLKLNGLPGMPS